MLHKTPVIWELKGPETVTTFKSLMFSGLTPNLADQRSTGTRAHEILTLQPARLRLNTDSERNKRRCIASAPVRMCLNSTEKHTSLLYRATSCLRVLLRRVSMRRPTTRVTTTSQSQQLSRQPHDRHLKWACSGAMSPPH